MSLHVHASYGEMTAIIDLPGRGGAALSIRRKPFRPDNASRADVRRVVRAARMHEAELWELWRLTHGKRNEDEEWEAPLDAETEAAIDLALAHARDFYEHEIATEARYLASDDLLLVVLKKGQRLAIPREDLQDLADADPDLVGRVEIEMRGTALHWEELDVDFRVDGLRKGLYGNEHWMRHLEEQRRSRAAEALSRTA